MRTPARAATIIIQYRDSGPHINRWQLISARTGTVLYQCQCLDAAARHASSMIRTTLHTGYVISGGAIVYQ